jgi:hypothetical protein
MKNARLENMSVLEEIDEGIWNVRFGPLAANSGH